MSNEHVNATVRGILDAICPPVKPPAPVTVEVSDDENTVTVTTRLEFVETYGNRCCWCAACGKEDICEHAPCLETNRKDGRRGYFREVRG